MVFNCISAGAKSFTIARSFQIFLYSVFGRTNRVFFIEIPDLFFVARVTRISRIPLDKRTENLKTNLFALFSVNHYSWQASPQYMVEKTFLLGMEEVGNIAMLEEVIKLATS